MLNMWRCLALVFLLSPLQLFFLAEIAQSQTVSVTTAPGIDLIFVIDHSGSMWKHPKYPSGPNDPGEHRVGAVRDAIERLAHDAERGRAVHTVTVIDFNSRVEVVLDRLTLSRIGGQPGALFAKARSEAAKVKARKEIDHPFTDTAGAFRRAVAVAGQYGPISPQRQRMTILVTDGRPYVDQPRDYAAMLSRQRESLRNSINELNALGFDTYAVGINDADDYWNAARYGVADGEFWNQVTGNRARLALRAFPDVSRLLGGILDDKLGARGVMISGDSVEMPTYRRMATFTVTADRPGAPLDVVDPNGRRWSAAPWQDAVSSRIVIPDPVPGVYRIVRQTGYSYSIRLETESPEVERVEPVGLAPLKAASRLVMRLKGGQGKTLPLNPADVASAGMTATAPSGAQQNWPLKVLPDGRLAADWTPTEAGVHAVALDVKVNDKGKTVDLFDAEDAPPLSVEVSSRRPLFLTLATPSPARTSDLYWPPPTIVASFGLMDADGRPMTAAEAGISDPNAFLTLQQVDETGVSFGAEISMVFDGQGRWSGDIPLDIEWTTGDGWWRPAVTRLRVRPAATLLGADLELDSLRLPDDTADLRIGGDRWTVGPLTAAVPWWLLVILATVAAALLFASLAALVIVGLPAVVVRNRDASLGGQLYIVIYDPIEDPLKTRALKLPVHGRYKTKGDGKLALSINGKAETLSRFRFKRDLSSTRTPRGAVVYRWPSDRKDRRMSVRIGEPPRPLSGHPQSQYLLSLESSK